MTEQAPPPRPLLSVPKVARQLGLNTNTILKMVDRGVLPAIDIALPGAKQRNLRFRAEDIDQFLDERAVKHSGFSADDSSAA